MNHKPNLVCVDGITPPKAAKVKVKTNTNAAALPTILLKLRNHALEDLHRMFGAMFYQADDMFFEYAHRADDPESQEACLNAMRELRLKQREIEKSFYTSIAKVFHRLPDPRFYKPASLESISMAPQLALVHNDELEESVTLEGMVKKARSQFSSQLYQINTRLDVLVLSVSVDQANSPFDPAVICEAIRSATHLVKCDIKYRLIFYKLFQRHILDCYDRVLDNCNFRLAKSGILPDLKDTPRQLRKTGGNIRPGEQSKEATKDTTATDAANEFFSQLQALMASVRQATETINSLSVIGSNSVKARTVENRELIDILTALQKIQPRGEAAVNGSINTQQNVRDTLSNFLKQQESRIGPKKVGEVDADVINFVAMLFDFILDDENLPVQVKAIIGRLQIPYLKVALLDRTFFNRAGHPARKLINEIARAGIGLSEQGDSFMEDAVFKKIQHVAQRVLDQFSENPNCFEEIYEEFNTFMKVEVRRSSMLEQRTRAVEEGRVRSCEAKRESVLALESRVLNKVLPDVVEKIINDVWINYLSLIFLKQGSKSNDWEHALLVVDRLIESVTPAKNPAHLKQLFAGFPTLLKDIRAGFSTLSYNPFKTGRLMEELEHILVQVLQGDTPDHLKPKLALRDEQGGDGATSIEESKNKKIGQLQAVSKSPQSESFADQLHKRAAVDPSSSKVARLDIVKKVEPIRPDLPELAENDEALIKAKSLPVGSWVEQAESDGTKCRRKLAAFIKSVDKLIFVNRSGVKVCEQCTLEVAHALKSGQLVILEDSLLFDRALENVIGNLRKIRQQSL